MVSPTVHPDQAKALVQIIEDTGAVAIDVAQDEHWSLRVVSYTASNDPAGPPAEAQFWSVSVCGTVREIAPTPDAVAGTV